MNIRSFVAVIRDRPAVCFGKNTIDSISDIGFFINGFLCAETAFQINDDFDLYFKNKFPAFVRKKLAVEPTEFEFWFETIAESAGNSSDAVQRFFSLFDEFCELYECRKSDG